ncbi:MAG: pilus assembly protein PilC [Planctomycetes bacterium DG_20]|nr:MAG: pilus assembly protein PilC [Planctomycetes bacterium DG_20]
MPIFQFEAMNKAGEEVKDEIEATTSEEAISKIRGLGYFPTSVKEKSKARRLSLGLGAAIGGKKGKKKGKTFAIGKASNKKLTQFTRQLSTLQDAGLPILRSIRILEGQQKPGVLKNALIDVGDDIEGGSSLSEAMAKHPKVFDRLYVNMVKAGETGGVLDSVLQRLADFREKSQRLKRRVIGAMIYPIMVVLVATGIVTFIMIAIIPKFRDIFEEFEVTLPAITEALIDVSHAFVQYWYLLPAVPIGLVVLVKLIRKNRSGRYAVDKIKLKLPVMGQIVNKTAISRFARTLGTLITAGVPILEALNIVRDTAGNEVVASAVSRVHDSIREGESIAGPLKQSRVCDDIVVNMIDVGEETGDLDKMLLKVADNYDEEVDVLVAGLISLMEPMLIIFLGGTVGFIVISLFMPLVKLITSLGSGGGTRGEQL